LAPLDPGAREEEMKRFTIIISALAVIMLLALPTAQVAANSDYQGPPPPEAVDMTVPDLSAANQVPALPEGEILLDVAPVPLQPAGGRWTYNKTPTFYFTKNLSATDYRIWVYDVRGTSKLLYIYDGAYTCGTAYCWMKPTTALKPWEYYKNGNYSWTVEALVGGTWYYYGWANFLVISTGFDTQFTTDAGKWMVVNGTWSITSKGYYKTNGLTGTNVSIMHKQYFDDEGYVFEVRYKRKVETGTATRFYIDGEPHPLWGTNRWEHGYNFITWNTGAWDFGRDQSGSYTVLYSGTSPNFEPLNWNTVKIWVRHDYIYVWLNGIYIGTFTAPLFDGGFVGIGMYEGSSDVSPLLIDYARVYYSAVWPEEIPLTESGMLGIEIQQNGDYVNSDTH
jgi:hypothetical protein